jgi:hypothetical protein
MISLYQDGENESPALGLILAGWRQVWETQYGGYGDLQFLPPLNLKDDKTRSTLLPSLEKIADIRKTDN